MGRRTIKVATLKPTWQPSRPVTESAVRALCDARWTALNSPPHLHQVATVSLVRGPSGTFAVVVHTSTHEIRGCGHRGGEKNHLRPIIGGGRSHAAASVLCMLAWSKILQSNGRGRGSTGGIRYCQDHLIGTWFAELDERGCGVPARNCD